MYEKRPTLTWGHVQTRERREKGCPQYRVFGSLRFWKDSAFWGLLSLAVFLLYCVVQVSGSVVYGRLGEVFLVNGGHMHSL